MNILLVQKKKNRLIWIWFGLEFNSFPASGDFCPLLITFANSLVPYQARQNVEPDLDPNCLTLMVYLKDFFLEKVNFKKKNRRQKSMQNYRECKELMAQSTLLRFVETISLPNYTFPRQAMSSRRLTSTCAHSFLKFAV